MSCFLCWTCALQEIRGKLAQVRHDGYAVRRPGQHNDSATLAVPIFHQGEAITDHIAWQMFSDAHRVLPQGGELWIVGNRHLDYHNKLKRLFANAQVVASNSKFVILKAIKR